MSPLQRHFAALAVLVGLVIGANAGVHYLPKAFDAPLILIAVIGAVSVWIYFVSVRCPICATPVHTRGSILRPDWLRGSACPKCGHDLNRRTP